LEPKHIRLDMASEEVVLSNPAAEQVIKAESGEGSEASEVSKTSEVKVEDSTKDNSETVLIDEDQRKLFVGGLAQEAKDVDVKEYFGQYGAIEHINLKHDPMTGRSRGFAFIVFKEVSGLIAASAQEAHVIKGKRATCKKAESRARSMWASCQWTRSRRRT